MTISIIIFSASLIFLWGMLLNKAREVKTGKPFFVFSSSLDTKLQYQVSFWGRFFQKVPRLIFKESFHFFVVQSVRLLNYIKQKIRPRVAHILDEVRGRGIPKNKGSASLFIQSIKDHKDNLKK